MLSPADMLDKPLSTILETSARMAVNKSAFNLVSSVCTHLVLVADA